MATFSNSIANSNQLSNTDCNTATSQFENDLPDELASTASPSELTKEQIVIAENWLTRKPDQWASLIALISTLIVTIGSLVYWNNFFDLAILMPASHESIFVKYEFWRVWSTLLVHADQKHLISNLFLFYILGYFLSGYFGLVVFPIAALAFGGLTNLIVLWGMQTLTTLIGLSGVVFWMGGTWLALYFLIERRKAIWQRLLRTLGVALVLFMPSEAFDPSISYKTHFVGFILGILFGFFYNYSHFTLFRSAEFNRIVTESLWIN
jgi:rhomboid protease GluP